MPTEYTEKHGKRTKSKAKKARANLCLRRKGKVKGESEFIPAANGQKQNNENVRMQIVYISTG